ncbi:nucleolar MIF4G domain-containing protein 1 isoform X1 [Chiloscyllium plagiosum]|uniref:nucleolar MIF4G domain-containing protein 1 isoform X1 n=1 Tax=Chiloscyllium plagiosum TaxID=36176 RepID=UPI001CB84DD2|nr:nucleolar MIF4G domain-containing protein 1 isoform X1 [Chiloscyllium plagiosum]
MKRDRRRGPRALSQFRVAVQTFVEKEEAAAVSPAEHNQGLPQDLGLRRGKTRKELRKEKRMQKKSRMRDYYLRKHLNGSPGLAKDVEGGSNDAKPLTAQGEAVAAPETGPGSLEGRKAVAPPRLAIGKASRRAKSKQARRIGLLEANQEEDEREIKRLEKALGLHKRKNGTGIPQAFARDGLDYVLGIIEPGAAALSGLYESDGEVDAVEEELKSTVADSDPGRTEDHEEDSGDDSDCGPQSEEDQQSAMEVEASDAEDDGQSSEPDRLSGNEGERISNEGTDSRKYIPLQLHEKAETIDAKKKEELLRLKKNIKGLLNRLSEPNMASISSQLEELYMKNSRKDMNDELTDVTLAACVTPALMPNRLMMEHVLLISILHHNVGIEVGAHVLEAAVKQFDEHWRKVSETKECDNLINLIAHFYNFHVINSVLVFDILKKLTSNFKEKDIELILLLLKEVGFTLRKDDAVALRDLILAVQSKASSVGKQFQDQTRIRFMLETMLALKNNDMRKIPGYDPEPVERLRKLQRSLIHNSRGDFLLRATLENLLTADQVGRWWIVGSSWSGIPMIGNTSTKMQQNVAVGEVSGKIMELARKQRMNTDIRKNIFCVMMTSEDYLDAFEKLLRLRLKDQQERDIIHVIVHCCLQEKTFNPFYAFLTQKFCEYDRRFQMTFQFSMWDRFRDLKSMANGATTNLVHLLVHLLSKKIVSLSVFKVIEFSELDKPKVKLLRHVLHKLLVDTEPEDLVAIFQRISGIPKLGLFREGLKLFLSHFLLKNASSLGSVEQANLLKTRVDIAEKALQTKDTILKF